MNICGCLVHATPEKVDAVKAAIEATDGGEVHAVENGRMVVTIEDAGGKMASEQIMDMHNIPGVLSVTLTYHHFEPSGADATASQPL
ncbi:MAG: chaperone NapD [Shimia sp.]|nr:chaperone NapD [Shimia sp.]